MNLETILALPEFQLPAINTTSDPFVIFIEKKLKSYNYLLKTSSADLLDGTSSKFLSFSEYTQSIDLLSRSLLDAIRLWKKNLPDEAYEVFKKMMNEAGPFINNNVAANFYTKPDDTFYRCKFNVAASLSPKEYFFHTPFQLSHKVKSTRFSSNGIPSMYLTNTMIVGYKETKAPSLSYFQGVKIQSKIPQSFFSLDYTSPSVALKTTNKEHYDYLLQVKGMSYPLMLCCYSQQNDGTAAAPDEYIIPQLLVRWVKANNMLYAGIKYPSTRIDNPNFVGAFYNLIVYPKKITDVGYCEELKQSFLISDVCCAINHQSEIDDFYKSSFGKFGQINPDVTAIDWLTKKVDYNLNEVGKMEFYLKHKLISGKIPF